MSVNASIFHRQNEKCAGNSDYRRKSIPFTSYIELVQDLADYCLDLITYPSQYPNYDQYRLYCLNHFIIA